MRRLAVLSLCTLAMLGVCAWVYFALELGENMPPSASVSSAADRRDTVRASSNGTAQSDALPTSVFGAERVDLLEGPQAARKPGYLVADPDSLVRVTGRIVDAETREPLSGIRLRFMSRRPRTCTVTSDSEGRFQTEAELAPGLISVVHLPDDEAPRFCVRWEMEPGEFLAADPAVEKGAREIILRARHPERVLEANIRGPDGAAAAGASVTLTYGRRDGAGEFVSEGRDYEVSDANGRVRFAQFGEDIFSRSFRIEAEHRGILASDVITLDPPIGARPLDIELHLGAVLRVQAKNDEGRPIANLSLWVSNNANGSFARGHNGDTDAHGDCLFAPLRPGCYSVSAVHPLTGETLQREIDLARGAQASIDFRLTLVNLRVGLSGVVLDEAGDPLSGISIRIQAPGESPVELATSESGRFEFWGRPAASLAFTIGTGFMDDEYEPAALVVPFGTTGISVRRLRSLETHTLPFAVVDKHSGVPVKRANIVLYHADRADALRADRADALRGDPAHALHSEQRFTAQAGVTEVSFKLRADSGFAVDAPGYVGAHGSLRALYDAYSHGVALRVELVPGFERRIEVRDRTTKRALAGARLFDGRRLSGTTDAQGSVMIASPEWPSSFQVECSGYAPLAWDPLAAGFPGDVIWLDPLRNAR